MVYAYIRVSTDKQTIENQKFESEKGLKVNNWVEEIITDTRKKREGKFGKLFSKQKWNDVLIVTEISRLGIKLIEIMIVLHDCMEKDITLFTVKEKYELGNNIYSKVLAFAFGLWAEIERKLISQWTKQALARKKAEGIILGRPIGSKSKELKLTKYHKKIEDLYDKKISFSAIARICGVHRIIVANYIKSKILCC